MKFSLISSSMLLALFWAPLRVLAEDELPNNDFIVDFVGDASLTIAEILFSNPNFSELYSGLVPYLSVLQAEGPITLFAPTNAAIQKLEEYSPGILEDWQAIAPGGSFGLPWSIVILYLIFEGTAKSTDIEDGLILEMLNGENATLMLNPPMIQDANIILTDVIASNGIIHVIDTFITPPSFKVYPGFFQVLNATGDFGIFLELLDSLNLTESLFTPNPHIIFPPTDEAFMKLGNLTDDEEVLLAIIGAHFVELDQDYDGLQDGEVLVALSGNNLTLSIINETTVLVDDSLIVFPDRFEIVSFNGVAEVFPPRLASNGYILGIDSVILPFDLTDPDTDLPDPVFPSAAVSHMSYWAAMIVLGLFAMLA